MQGERRGRQITGKVERALGRIERCHNACAQPTRHTHQARQANQTALGLISTRGGGKVLDVVRDLMQHGIRKTGS